MSTITLSGSGLLKGTFSPPGDKSISHRALMFGALSAGKSSYTHFLEAEDCLSTLNAFQSMGVDISLEKGSGKVTINGVGLQGLKAPSQPMDLGNSGTSIRLLMGILAGQRFEATLTGDESLRARPMRRVTDPLKKMGAQIKGADKANFAPLTIRGGKLQGLEYDNQLASAQVKSAILFAGLYADGKTRIHDPFPSRDHSERFLQACQAPFKQEGDWLEIEKADSLKPLQATIPGDISSAAFFIVGAAITPGSEVTIENVCLNPTRAGLLDVLKRMGAKLEIVQTATEPEPIGTLHVEGTRLQGTSIRKTEIPALIDELPILMTAMALAQGESLVSGAEELRVKETDRIHSMVTNLKAIGADIEELPDGCLIRGVEAFQGAKVQSFGDHRTAMSMAVAALAMREELVIEGTGCIGTSFPTFFQILERLKRG